MNNPFLGFTSDQIQSITGRLQAEIIAQLLVPGSGVHLETAIAGAGAIAGYYLLAATKTSFAGLKTGQVILVEEINIKGPQLFAFMSAAALRIGLPHSDHWNATVPVDHQSLKTGTELTSILRPALERIFTDAAVDLPLRARLAVLVGLDFIKQGNAILNADIGKSILSHAIVAASKTVP